MGTNGSTQARRERVAVGEYKPRLYADLFAMMSAAGNEADCVAYGGLTVVHLTQVSTRAVSQLRAEVP
jgi:hypothetical protein